MKKANVTQQAMPLYNSEYRLFDGEEFVTFNFLDMNTDKYTVTIAVNGRENTSVMQSAMAGHFAAARHTMLTKTK